MIDRAMVAVVVAAAQLVGVPLLLGGVGLLAAGPYLATHMVVAAVAVMLTRGRGGFNRLREGSTVPTALVFAAGGALAAVALLPSLRGDSSQGFESRHYHLANLTAWLDEGSIWTLPFENPGFFTATHPGNVELSAAGWFFATGDDSLLYLGNLLWAMLAVVAGGSIARQFARPASLGGLAVLATLGTHLVFFSQAHALTSDMAVAAGLLAGVAALLHAWESADPRWALTVGLSVGLAIGSKYTAGVVGLLILGIGVTRLPRRAAVTATIGAVSFTGPWLFRNAVETGNPLFPLGIRVGSAEILPEPTTPLSRLETSVAERVIAGEFRYLATWFDAALERIGPVGFLLFCVGAVGAVVRSPGQRRLRVPAAAAIVGVAAYAVTPYTAPDVESVMASNLRYALPALLLGIVLATVVLPRVLVIPLLVLALAHDAWTIADGVGWRPDLEVGTTGGLVVLAGGGAAAVCYRVGSLLNSPRWIVPLGAIAVFVGSTVVVGRGDNVADATPLAHAIASTGASDVTAVGVFDLRSVIGDDLGRSLHVLPHETRFRTTPSDPDELDRSLLRVRTPVLVIQEQTPGVPPGYVPPEGWELVAQTAGGDVYRRSSD